MLPLDYQFKQYKLQKILDVLPEEKVEQTCGALMKFSKNLLNLVVDSDKFKNVKNFLGIGDTLQRAHKDGPGFVFTNFDFEYGKNDRKKFLLSKRSKNIIQEAAIPCDLTTEFIETVRNIGLENTALILEASRSKYQSSLSQ